MTFKRVQKLTKSVDDVAKALESSELVEVSTDKKRIRRKTKLPEVDNSEDRTCYAKGFTEEATQEELEEFFDKLYPNEVGSVRMRKLRGKDKKFKGSVFVEFKSVDTAKKFSDSKEMKFKEKDLLVLPKTQYTENKKKERENKKRKRKVVEFDEKFKEVKNAFTKCITQVSNIGKLEGDHQYMEIKKTLSAEIEGGNVFVEHPCKGDYTKAYARFTDQETAEKFVNLAQTKEIKLGGQVVKVEYLSEEGEDEFLKKLVEVLLEQSTQQPKRKNRKKGKRRD